MYKLTEEDIDNERVFEDTIAIYPRFYDILSPTGTWDDHVVLKDLDKTYGIPLPLPGTCKRGAAAGGGQMHQHRPHG